MLANLMHCGHPPAERILDSLPPVGTYWRDECGLQVVAAVVLGAGIPPTVYLAAVAGDWAKQLEAEWERWGQVQEDTDALA